jgi:Glycosyl hydrolase catalytic core
LFEVMRFRLSRVALAVLVAMTVVATAAVPAAARGHGGRTKRGVASSQYLRSSPSTLAAIGATWAHNWSAQAPPRARGLEWVPMVWGPGFLTPAVRRSLRTAARRHRARYLLAFNEPDSTSQSNMTPDQAAALWPELERTGLRLGSPAPQVPGDGWLDRFIALAEQRRLRVDFIALHYYQDFTNPHAVSDLRRQLIRIHRRYEKPIWITEIGAIDIRSWGENMLRVPTVAMADSYIGRLFAMLDRLPFVQRYAWFTDVCWGDPDCRFGSLFDASGHLTPAGHVFAAAR